MKPEWRVKLIFAVMVLFGLLMLMQMGLYVAHHIWNVPIHWNILEYCIRILSETSAGHSGITWLVHLFIVYTTGRIVWRICKQWMDTRKYVHWFRTFQHRELSEQLNNQYRHWNIEIIVIKKDTFLALAWGLWNPKIIVSTALFNQFDEREIRAILLHERYHCRSRDGMKLFLTTLMVDAFGYLPIVKSISRYYETWKELLADRYAVDQMGNEYDLGNVLLKLVKSETAALHRTAGVHFAKTAINYRIQQILEPNKAIHVPMALTRPLLLSSLIVLAMSIPLLGGCS